MATRRHPCLYLPSVRQLLIPTLNPSFLQGLIGNSSITMLNLSNNGIGAAPPSATPTATSRASASAAAYSGPGVLLAELMRRHRSLKELDLGDNPLLGEEVGQGGGAPRPEEGEPRGHPLARRGEVGPALSLSYGCMGVRMLLGPISLLQPCT